MAVLAAIVLVDREELHCRGYSGLGFNTFLDLSYQCFTFPTIKIGGASVSSSLKGQVVEGGDFALAADKLFRL